MKDDYYLVEGAYDYAKKGYDLYEELKRGMERDIRERLEKEIRLEMMKLLVMDAKRKMNRACKERDLLIKKEAPDKDIYLMQGEANAYRKQYRVLRIVLNQEKKA